MVDIPANVTPGLDGNECWVIVEQAGYDYTNNAGVPNLANTDPLAAFFRHSLSVSNVVPEWINVTSPNGGEQWTGGSTYDITWTSQAVPGAVTIEYSKDNFVSDINTIVASTPNTGDYQWKVPNDPSTTVRVRISDAGNPTVFDTSDADFTILPKPTLQILVPNGGEVWDSGSTYDITWESTGSIANVKIGYSKDNFVSDVHVIIDSTPNNGDYQWQVPDDPSTTVKVGIVDTADPSVYDLSDANFTIQAAKPTITVTSPNGGESWQAGKNHDITWTSTGVLALVKIEYSKDNFVSDINTIIDSTPNTGSYTWQVPDDPSTTVLVRVTDTADASVFDVSDNDFSIVEKPTIKVISPNGGEVWYVGSNHNITYQADPSITNVKIGYSKDGFVNDVNVIIDSTPNTGSYPWQVPNDPSTTVKVGIIDTADATDFDLSDHNFTIKAGTVSNSLYWNQFMHDASHGELTGAIGPQASNYVWTHQDGTSGSPAYIVEGFDGTLYYGSGQRAPGNGGSIWAVNPDGSTKWTYNSQPGGHPIPLGISTDNSILYVGTQNFPGGPAAGAIIGVDTSSGNQLWTCQAWDVMGWFNGTNFGLVLDNGDFVTAANLPNQPPGQSSIIRIDEYGNIKWSKQIAFNWWSAPAKGPDGTLYVNVQPFFRPAGNYLAQSRQREHDQFVSIPAGCQHLSRHADRCRSASGRQGGIRVGPYRILSESGPDFGMEHTIIEDGESCRRDRYDTGQFDNRSQQGSYICHKRYRNR